MTLADVDLHADSPMAREAMREARLLVAARLDLLLTTENTFVPADSYYRARLSEAFSGHEDEVAAWAHFVAAVVALAAVSIRVTAERSGVESSEIMQATAMFLEHNPKLTF